MTEAKAEEKVAETGTTALPLFTFSQSPVFFHLSFTSVV